MNSSYQLIRALRGPILLMALGGLMYLHRFDDFSLAKTWPVLLILLGLMKLAERMVMRSGAPPLGGSMPGAGGQI